MESSEPRELIRDFLVMSTGERAISDDLDIFERGLVNSMFVMQLVVFVEREFGLAVVGADLDFNHFRTVDRITEFVYRKRSAA